MKSSYSCCTSEVFLTKSATLFHVGAALQAMMEFFQALVTTGNSGAGFRELFQVKDQGYLQKQRLRSYRCAACNMLISEH